MKLLNITDYHINLDKDIFKFWLTNFRCKGTRKQGKWFFKDTW